MKHWLGRTPRTVGDWLGLALGTALIFGGVAQLPALAAALGQLAVMLRPFLWGLVLAYVLDIPTRWLAAKWFGGRRGAGAAVSYALLFGAAGLLLWLILPQLAQSVTSLFGKLAAYEETLRRLLAWVQATFGAVSYTHLDVYKRQACGSPRPWVSPARAWAMSTTPSTIWSTRTLSLIHISLDGLKHHGRVNTGFLRQGQCLGQCPVSYTHLDVYKRQPLKRN